MRSRVHVSMGSPRTSVLKRAAPPPVESTNSTNLIEKFTIICDNLETV